MPKPPPTNSLPRHRFQKLQQFIKILENKHVNLFITTFLIFLSLYFLLISLFNRPILDPMFVDGDEENLASNLTDPSKNKGIIRPDANYESTVLSLLFLLVSALFFGQIAEYAKLPPLLGHLLTGIFIRNIPFLSLFFQIHSSFSRFFTQFAFILILIRCGLNLDLKILRKSMGIFCSLGFLSTTIEAIAILAASLLFGLNFGLSLLFAFVLASTSPAVTVPSMIQLHEHELGTNKGIPTMILAAATIDNIFSVTMFSVASSIVFAARNSSLLYSLVSVPVELFIGIFGGIFFGLLLWYFPRSNHKTLLHFLRPLLLCSLSLAILFGTRVINHTTVGPVTVVLMCIIVAFKWKKDNKKGVKTEQFCFKILWESSLQPFLFALIGLLLDFSETTLKIFLFSLLFTFFGVLTRFGSIFGMSMLMKGFNLKEKLFISVCFYPKATVQAALAPLILQGAEMFPDQFSSDSIQIVFQTCILSILFTAPAGQLIIWQLGRKLLHQGPPHTPSIKKPDEQKENEDLDMFDDIEPNNSASNNIQASSKKKDSFEEVDLNGVVDNKFGQRTIRPVDSNGYKEEKF